MNIKLITINYICLRSSRVTEYTLRLPYFQHELGAILVICTHTCYIYMKFCIFVYQWFGFVCMTMNIYVFLQIMNILCIFCRPGLCPGFFPGSDSGHIFGFAGFRAGPVLITLVDTYPGAPTTHCNTH